MKQDNNYIQEIKAILKLARQKTYAAINSSMVEAYWKIGERIVQEEQHGEKRAAYGEFILKELSKALTADFGKGFSYPNLKNFRQFYLTYSNSQISYTLCSQLSWSHNRLIMRVEEESARKWYLNEAASQSWSVRELERNINTFSYHRLAFAQRNNTTPADSNNSETQPHEFFVKDPYVFEFLNISETQKSAEQDIESALIENLQQFMLELGKGFSFVGRQLRISTELEHFYIDLVFYNYILKCFVLIDLKSGKLNHQDIGQIDMYRRMYDDLKKPESDNPTIGIILCTEKSETIVKYSIINDNTRMFAARYKSYLPTEEELIAEIEREKLVIKEKLKDKADPLNW